MDNDVFLDTSSLIDLHFRSPELRRHVLDQIEPGSRLHSSRYVVFELARGFLTHLLTLHNKANDLDSLSELIRYAGHRSIGGQYAGPTMLGAYGDFLKHLERQGAALTEEQRLMHFRAWLAPHIRRAWRKVNDGRLPLSNTVGCHGELPDPATRRLPGRGRPREHMEHDVPKKRCGQLNNCGLMDALASGHTELQKMLDSMGNQPKKPDAETTRRRDAMRRLLSHDSSLPFAGRDCHSSGDALIVHEAADGQVLLTKNGKHQRPLAAALGKPVISYGEPSTQPQT